MTTIAPIKQAGSAVAYDAGSPLPAFAATDYRPYFEVPLSPEQAQRIAAMLTGAEPFIVEFRAQLQAHGDGC